MSHIRKGFRTRRGRPASTRAIIDKGTPELVAKRDAGLTREVIDVLHKSGKLNDQELWCALHFRWLYHVRFGSPTVRTTDPARPQHYHPPSCEEPNWRVRYNAQYRQISVALDQRCLLAPLLNIAVFNDFSILSQTNKAWQLFYEALGYLQSQWKPQ
jgi:hypothetical protein